jgi:flagellar protein FliO/FliZ
MMRSAAITLALGAPLPALAATTGAYAGPSTAASLVQVFVGLVAVLAMIAGSAWLARRFGVTRASMSSLVSVVGSTSVGVRERVVVVEVGDTWLVVGVAPGSVNALASLPRGEAPTAHAAASPASFAARLSTLVGKHSHGRQTA